MRRFDLVQNEDKSGISETGVVAVGVKFANGYVELQCSAMTATASTCE